MRLGFAAAIAITCTACGARSGLGVYEADDVRDAAPDTPDTPDAADTHDAPEGSCDRTAPPGTVVWQTSLPPGVKFTAEAADPSGNTYFLGLFLASPNAQDAYFVVALDRCGRELWTIGPVRKQGSIGTRGANLLLSGDQVIVKWTSVDAYDRNTVAHLWDVDLAAIDGRRWASADWGPIAAAADGTSFVGVSTSLDYGIVSIGPGGNASTLASNVPRGTGSFDLTSVIVDGAGHVDVLLNATLRGPLVESFSRT